MSSGTSQTVRRKPQYARGNRLRSCDTSTVNSGNCSLVVFIAVMAKDDRRFITRGHKSWSFGNFSPPTCFMSGKLLA